MGEKYNGRVVSRYSILILGNRFWICFCHHFSYPYLSISRGAVAFISTMYSGVFAYTAPTVRWASLFRILYLLYSFFDVIGVHISFIDSPECYYMLWYYNFLCIFSNTNFPCVADFYYRTRRMSDDNVSLLGTLHTKNSFSRL